VSDDVVPGWSARLRARKDRSILSDSSAIRGNVRSAHRDRPCTGSRTSARRTAKTASAVQARNAPSSRLESPRGLRAEENGVVITYLQLTGATTFWQCEETVLVAGTGCWYWLLVLVAGAGCAVRSCQQPVTSNQQPVPFSPSPSTIVLQ